MKLYSVLFLCYMVLILFSCNHGEVNDFDKHECVVFTFDSVKKDYVKDCINLNGKVVYDQDLVVEIFPLFGGNVKEVRVELGDYVKKGDILAVIKSSEVAEYEKELKEAKSQLILAQKNMDVVVEMGQSGLMSERDILSAEKDLSAAKAEVLKLNEIFEIYNINNNSEYIVKSPVSGFVVEKNINREMQLRSDKADNIFTVSGLENVWIVANVYESDISKIEPDLNVTITALAYRDKVFRGKIDKVYNVVDDQSKTMGIRIKLLNPDFLLKPGMHVNVSVEYNYEKNYIEYICPESLIFDNGDYFVVKKTGNDIYSVVRVVVYKQISQRVYVVDGLSCGDEVCVGNSLLLYNDLKKLN